ncbi:MAG: class I SAM-dependent methyltransferase [Anaerolineaceae bacterium]|nr:class I SAM-dependent methyltransferase [Anaerolineaceae bacterium]
MDIVHPERFDQLVTEALDAHFEGWDFTWLEGRLVQEETPWNYPEIVHAHFAQAHSLLDLGTGGGELLASLGPLPPDTHATEAYPPNQNIARQRLEPLGVTVHAIEDKPDLPFNYGQFDLVINRHEYYAPEEVYRILKPGGRFITQQVGGLDNLELNQALENEISFPFLQWGLAEALTGLYEAGFQVSRAEKAALRSTFRDIGAVVYYLKAIPWQIEGFDPQTSHDKLVRLHNLIERQGEFVATAHRFLIMAQKEGD